MTLTTAYASTTVKFDKSMADIERMLTKYGVRESRFTHMRPERPPKTQHDRDVATRGAVVYEFVYHGKAESERRGVRITVGYQPQVTPRGAKGGTTAEMAGRALYWFLKAKFDSIEYGIEAFDVAFMPHLVTALGETFAERPTLIGDAVSHPESIGMLALPAGGRDA